MYRKKLVIFYQVTIYSRMLSHWHKTKPCWNESVTKESSCHSWSFYLSFPFPQWSNITLFPHVFPCFSFPYVFPSLCPPVSFHPIDLRLFVGPRHKALRNCSRQASRLPNGPGAAKAACSWPEGVCKVCTNLRLTGRTCFWCLWWWDPLRIPGKLYNHLGDVNKNNVNIM